MNDKNLYLKGDMSKGMMVSEKIVEELQKKRYDLLDRGTDMIEVSVIKGWSNYTQKRVMKDVVDCEKTILESVKVGFQSSLNFLCFFSSSLL